MNVELRTPTRSDRSVIRNMMELYLYDFSEFEDADLDEHGLYGFDELDYYWFEPTYVAFLATVDGKLAGFVLVDDDVLVEGNERSICEFFVLRKYRRRGVGRQVACQVFDRLPARWEVRVIAQNAPAQVFWRSVIADYAQGAFQVTMLDDEDWRGPAFSFDNRAR